MESVTTQNTSQLDDI